MGILGLKRGTKMKKQFIRTATFEYVNLDYVIKISYNEYRFKEGNAWRIKLKCSEETVTLGFVLSEDIALDIINDIIHGVPILDDYCDESEAIDMLKKNRNINITN